MKHVQVKFVNESEPKLHTCFECKQTDEQVDRSYRFTGCTCRRIVYFHTHCHDTFWKRVDVDPCPACGKRNGIHSWDIIIYLLFGSVASYHIGNAILPAPGGILSKTLLGGSLIAGALVGIGTYIVHDMCKTMDRGYKNLKDD
jgi:hypothetical protein